MKLTFVIVVILTVTSIALGHTHVLVINGISKDPIDRAAKNKTVQDLKTSLLDKGGVDPNRLTVLAGEETRANEIEKAMRTLVSRLNHEDRLIFYYIGQANAVGESLRFNIAGEDITGQQITQWLNHIEAKNQLVVLDCPRAAMVAKEITKPNRIIVFASTEAQAYGTRLSLHFVPALKQKETDTNVDGRLSVLEAFTTATRGIEQWYRDNQVLPTETPNLEDNADGVPSERPWRYIVEGGDGQAASKFVLVTL